MTVPFKEYQLTASRGGRTETVKVIGQADYGSLRFAKAMKAADPEAAAIQWDATTDAIRIVLNKGKQSELWSKGHIVLQGPDGEILREMEEKP